MASKEGNLFSKVRMYIDKYRSGIYVILVKLEYLAVAEYIPLFYHLFLLIKKSQGININYQ